MGWKTDRDPEAQGAFDARRIYDSAKRGYGNRGHTFGDPLSALDRKALLEYLKTL